MLEETGLDPDALLLEITESAVMEDTDLSEAMLRGLNGLGVRVAIDEFGTGYSSLAYLKRFNSAVGRNAGPDISGHVPETLLTRTTSPREARRYGRAARTQ